MEPLDMRPRCIICGVDMWPCKANKVYCSPRCIRAHNTMLEREAKAEAFKDRRCETCHALMPVTMRADARWCSKACKNAVPHYYRGTRICGWCGDSFRAVNKDQATCSISCGQRFRQSKQRAKG